MGLTPLPAVASYNHGDQVTTMITALTFTKYDEMSWGAQSFIKNLDYGNSM